MRGQRVTNVIASREAALRAAPGRDAGAIQSKRVAPASVPVARVARRLSGHGSASRRCYPGIGALRAPGGRDARLHWALALFG